MLPPLKCELHEVGSYLVHFIFYSLMESDTLQVFNIFVGLKMAVSEWVMS